MSVMLQGAQLCNRLCNLPHTLTALRCERQLCLSCQQHQVLSTAHQGYNNPINHLTRHLGEPKTALDSGHSFCTNNPPCKCLSSLKDLSAGQQQAKAVPVTMNEMLLRGCTLKNTGYILGLAVYTGNETRIQKNSAKTPNKIGQLLISFCAALLASICSVLWCYVGFVAGYT